MSKMKLRSEAQITKSLTPDAIRITEEFGWDFFKAGILVEDEREIVEWVHIETCYLLVREAKVKEVQPDGSKKWVLSNKGKWNLPCGRLQKWESFEEAAKRECLEESGIVAEPYQICHIGHRFDIDNPYVIVIYSAHLSQVIGTPNPEEIAEIGWFRPVDIEALAARGMLRNPELTLGALRNRTHGISPLCDAITTYGSKYAGDAD